MTAVQVTSFGTPTMTRATTGSVTGTWGTGQSRLAGNVLVAVVTAGGTTASAAAISTPSGWTQQKVISNTATTANTWAAVYTKVAAGSDSAPAFTATLSGTVAMTCTLLELAAASTLAPVDASGTYASGGTAGTLSSMAVTTGSTVSQAGDYALAVFVQEAAAATNTWNSGGSWTNLVTDGTTSSVLHTAIDYRANPTSGSTLSETGHWTTDTTAYGTAILVSFAPLGGALELYTNEGATTISSGGTTAPAAGTPEVWTAASWSSFPAVSQTLTPRTRFHVADPAAPSELIEVVNTSTGLVIRGAEGTTPVSHSSGFAVSNVATADGLASAPQTYNVRSTAYGAKGDGSTDDYAAIQAALTACAGTAGGTAYLPPGVYITSQILQIGSNTTLMGAGAGITTIRAQNSFSPTQVASITGVSVLITPNNAGASNVTIEALTIDANEHSITSLPGYANSINGAVMLTSVTGLTFNNAQIINSINYAFWAVQSTNVTVSNCDIVTGSANTSGYTQQDGVHLTGCQQCQIVDNYIDTGTGAAGDDAIALQTLSSGDICEDITITGNVIRSAQTAVHMVPYGGNVINVTFSQNVIWETVADAVSIVPGGGTGTGINLNVSGNVLRNIAQSSGGGGAAFDIENFQGVTISGNVVDGLNYATSNFVYTTAGSDLVVSGNTLINPNTGGMAGGAVAIGIEGAGVTNFTVAGNTVDCSGMTAGTNPVCIQIADSYDGTVNGNFCYGNGDASSVGVQLLGNSVSGGATGVTVDANRIKNCGYGVDEVNSGEQPDYNTITGNILKGCTVPYSLSGPHDLILDSSAGGGRVDVEQFVALSSSYTLANSTSAQKLFNATTNGTLTVQGSTSYFFDCEFDLSGMSTTSKTLTFALGGTATLTSVKYNLAFTTVATGAFATPSSSVITTSSIAFSTTNTSATASVRVTGIIRVNASGTIIPQFTMSVANAASVVAANSWFRIWPAGSNTITSLGNWS